MQLAGMPDPLSPWGRPGIESTSSWIWVGFLTCWATMELPKEMHFRAAPLHWHLPPSQIISYKWCHWSEVRDLNRFHDSALDFFFFFFFFAAPQHMDSPGSDPSHSCNLRQSCGKGRSLTRCAGSEIKSLAQCSGERHHSTYWATAGTPALDS